MIIVDSSSLVAIIKGEPDAQLFADFMRDTPRLIMSASTKLEIMIVAGGQFADEGLRRARLLITDLDFDIAPWTDALSDLAATAFMRFGKGRHPAKLNFGDCISYALAKSLDAPLLYKGGDFAKTDIRSALA